MRSLKARLGWGALGALFGRPGKAVRVGRFGVGVLYATTLGVALLNVLLGLGVVHSRIVLEAEGIRGGGGYDFYYDLPGRRVAGLLVARADDNARPGESRVVLLEGKTELGPAHASHDDVRRLGGGRFSHWRVKAQKGVLVFSSSDNSDPRENGRVYSAVVRWSPGKALHGITGVLLVAATGLLVVRERRRWYRRCWGGEALPLWGALLFTGFALLLLVALAEAGVFRGRGATSVSATEPIGGYGYSYAMGVDARRAWPLTIRSDHNERPARSSLSLYENGRPLGPAHTEHAAIVKDGGGAFSHWGRKAATQALIFSSSDNSDPRTNGRTYTFEYPLQPRAWAWSGAWVLTIVGLLGAYKSASASASAYGKWVAEAIAGTIKQAVDGRVWFVVVLAAGIWMMWHYAVNLPAVPLLFSDSDAYLGGSILVPLGYTWVLGGVDRVFGSLAVLPALQAGIWLASVLGLYRALVLYGLARGLAGVTCVALLALGSVTKYSMFVLTESLFCSVLLMHVTSVLLALEKPTRLRFVLIGLTAFAGGFLRPAGLFMAVSVVFLLPVIAGRARFLTYAVGGMVGAFLLTGAISQHTRGVATQSLLGYALFPYVLPIFEAGDVRRSRALAELCAPVAEAYRRELAGQETREGRILHEMSRFNAVSRECQVQLVGAGLATTEEIEGLMRAWALEAIAARPGRYAGHVLDHTLFAWGLVGRYTNPLELGEAYRAGEAQHDALAERAAKHGVTVPRYRYGELEQGSAQLSEGVRAFYVVPHALQGIPSFGQLLGLLSAGVVIAAGFLYRRHRGIAGAAYVGVLLHAGVLLITGSTIVIPRYLDPLLPIGLVFLALTAHLLGGVLVRRVGERVARLGSLAAGAWLLGRRGL